MTITRNIQGQFQAPGGSPANILLGLARAGAPFPLLAAGFVGKDASGTFLLDQCRRHKVDATRLLATSKAPTSFTDVMTERSLGRRTFFHARGANALWRGADLNFARTTARIFHLGHLLLLDALDAPDEEFGTAAARLLAAARRAGLKTSIDVVSEESERFAQIVTPALKQTDYCILNEIEAGKTAGFKIRTPQGRLDTVALRHTAGTLLQHGASELVVVHFPEGAFARTRRGEDFWQPSLKLPPDYIRGAVGAGDAFCAGILLGLHERWEIPRCLRIAVCLAAACLSDATATAGIHSLDQALGLARRFGFRPPLELLD